VSVTSEDQVVSRGARDEAVVSTAPELRLLLEDRFTLPRPPVRYSAIGSALVHVLFIALLPFAFQASAPRPLDAPAIRADLKSTPLVAPPTQLTQREPGTGEVRREVNLEGLLARPAQPPPAPKPSVTAPAARELATAPAAPPPAPKLLPEPPKMEPQQVAGLDPRNLPPAFGAAPGLPQRPQIESEEKPKLAFETPGSRSGQGSDVAAPPGAIPRPAAGAPIEEVARATIQTGSRGGLVVGDFGEGVGGLGPSLSGIPAPPRNASSLELLSDPQGVDFRPYLIRILSTVKRNWLAVMPESARMGRRGKVQIQFAINRDGSVPKLVISLPSGTHALDRAAVAGISASNPFPPLPQEFQGEQVRLQFTFLYNMPVR
jgi:TonB family protein